MVYKEAKKKIIKGENKWKKILCDIVNALQDIHHCSYVHDDLNRNNIVLEDQGRFPPESGYYRFQENYVGRACQEAKTQHC